MDDFLMNFSNLHINNPKVTKKTKKSQIIVESKQHFICKKYLQKHNIIFSEEVRYSLLNDKRTLPCDFQIIVNGRVGIIEIDGKQHFEFTSRFQKTKEDFEKQLYHDYLKYIFCKKNKINLLRISYKEYEKEYFYLDKFIQYLSNDIQQPIIMFSNNVLYNETFEIMKKLGYHFEKNPVIVKPHQNYFNSNFIDNTTNFLNFDTKENSGFEKFSTSQSCIIS
jgi:hypothetical protein